MLKNIAIPLMLAASEAEAQKKPSPEQVREALEGDLEKAFRGLMADSESCTAASDTDIAALAQTVSDKKAAQELADKAVADSIAEAGAFGLAQKARQEAVAAAVAQEAAENIAGLLDALDNAAEAERVEAEKWVAAVDLYEAGVRRAAAALIAKNAATDKLADLLAAKTAATGAVTAAKEQATKESLWRGWRYCELSASVTNASVPDAQRGWWQMTVQPTYTVAEPNTCEVPAVSNADGVEQRGAVTYYTTAGAAGLAAEPDDGTSQWSATVKLTKATTAENAQSSPALMGGVARQQAGQVAWYTGDLRAKTWVWNMRKSEQTFYGGVKVAYDAARGVANSMATDDQYDQPGTLVAPFLNNDPDSTLMTASAAGAAKALSTQADTRDSTATGSGKTMPQKREANQNAGEGWKTIWTSDLTQMNAWKTNNGTKGAAWLWWEKATAVTTAMDTWWTAWGTDSAQMTAGSMTNAAVGSAVPCDNTAANGGTWQTGTTLANIGACKTACETASINALLVDKDISANGQVSTSYGGKTIPVFEGNAVTAWCGAYSWLNASTNCQLLLGATGATQGTQVDASDACNDMSHVDTWAGRQEAVRAAYALATDATLVSNLAGAADAQAALEKAWLQAWYVQQYWANLKIQLTGVSADPQNDVADANYGTQAKAIEDKKTTLDGGNGGNDDSVTGAQAIMDAASTTLTAAQESLATLQATTAAAQAVVSGLGTRILRADAQIAELKSLAADDGTSGTLDQAAALRVAEHDTFANDGTAQGSVKGGHQLALDELAAADAAVADRNADTVGTGGGLTEGKLTAEAEWTRVAGLATQAASALESALSGADLVALRQKVEDDTKAWDDALGALEGLASAAEDAEAATEGAEKALATAVLACQIKAYDEYRTTLEEEMVQRAADLVKIKALLETQLVEPAAGTVGARCEKAISNGTYRPARGETTCGEGLCCGAARVWMSSGTTADAGWRTIETCQTATDTTYNYQPARAAMALDMPKVQTVNFACIEGAKTLAAAASAVAAAVYMLA